VLRILCILLLCLIAVPALPDRAAAEDTPIVLQPFVWAGYQEYLDLPNPGAFAVSDDGSIYGYSYCEERRCKFNTSKRVALKSCSEGGGENCVVFAVKREIQLPYRLLDLALADGCPAAGSDEKSPDVVVIPDIDEVVYDHAHDIDELTNLEQRGKARVNPVDFELLGLTIHQFSRGNDESGTTLVRGDGGQACAGFAAARVHLRMTTTIYVASEFPKASCLYEEVLAHEERHHAVGRRLFYELAAAATRLLRADLVQQPYVAVAESSMVAAAARARIDAAIDTAYREFWQDYDEEQKRIDTEEEYLRVAAACTDARAYLR
jgi:hypothetical protein